MRRKKVLVDIYLAKNLGDDLFLDHLSQSFPDTDFVPFHPGKNYSLFFEQYDNIQQFPYTLIDKIAARFGRNKLTDYKTLSQNHDALLFLGGGIFREESYWKEVFDYRINIVKAFQSQGKKVYFSGCNFGPYQSRDFVAAHEQLFKSTDKIVFRDQKSYQLFAHLNQVFYAPDLLWSFDLPTVQKEEKLLGISVVDPRHKAGYEDTYEDYILAHQALCKEYHEKGYRVMLFSFCEAEGDLAIAQKIASASTAVEIVNYESNIPSYLQEIGKCSMFIAARFHAVIMAMKFGIPVVPVIYSDKTENLLIDLNCTTPFVFLDTIDQLNNAEFFTLTKLQLDQLHFESQRHFDLIF